MIDTEMQNRCLKLFDHLRKRDYSLICSHKGLSFLLLCQSPYQNYTLSGLLFSLIYQKNIFNFTIRYTNNTLPTRQHLSKWGLAISSDCQFCLKPESLLHFVAGCNNYLTEGRYTCWLDSVLYLIALSLQGVKDITLYADLPGFISPSVNTRNKLRPDLLFTCKNTFIEMIKEITVEHSHQEYILKKISAITIRSTTFIFCRRGRDWLNPLALN